MLKNEYYQEEFKKDFHNIMLRLGYKASKVKDSRSKRYIRSNKKEDNGTVAVFNDTKLIKSFSLDKSFNIIGFTKELGVDIETIITSSPEGGFTSADGKKFVQKDTWQPVIKTPREMGFCTKEKMQEVDSEVQSRDYDITVKLVNEYYGKHRKVNALNTTAIDDFYNKNTPHGYNLYIRMPEAGSYLVASFDRSFKLKEKIKKFSKGTAPAGGYTFTHNKVFNEKYVAVFEGMEDALSSIELGATNPEETIYIVAFGISNIIKVLNNKAGKYGKQIVIHYDNDKASEKFREVNKWELLDTKAMYPPEGYKDYNEFLLERG